MKTAVLGAGARGSVIGAALSKAGIAVVLIDVARKVIDKINHGGLRIESLESTFPLPRT